MKHKMAEYLIVRALHKMTAGAMGVPFRMGKPPLRAYAAFTKEQAGKISKDELPAVSRRMYFAAFRMGSLLRKVLFIRSDARARRTLFFIYRCIGIEPDGPCPGTFKIRRCFFSGFYTPEICRVMSAMDRGIFAGIFGGGELSFSSRITEGCPFCLAEFSHEGNEVL